MKPRCSTCGTGDFDIEGYIWECPDCHIARLELDAYGRTAEDRKAAREYWSKEAKIARANKRREDKRKRDEMVRRLLDF